MESDLLHVLKELFYLAIGPVVGLFAWIGKRMHNRMDGMERKISLLDIDNAVQQSKLVDIKEDISHLDKKLDKILDKVR